MEYSMELAGGILGGMVLGATLAWLLARSRWASIQTRLEEKEKIQLQTTEELRTAVSEKADLSVRLSVER